MFALLVCVLMVLAYLAGCLTVAWMRVERLEKLEALLPHADRLYVHATNCPHARGSTFEQSAMLEYHAVRDRMGPKVHPP